MNFEHFTGSFYGRAFAVIFVSFMSLMHASAQEETVDSVVPIEAQQFFNRLTPKKDTTNLEALKKYRQDKFIKRVSIHTNVVDWATLVPNIGLEIDLKDSPRNNYSVSIFGKYNGNSTHGSLVYNVAAIRVEGRKYWRTGKFGRGKNSQSKLYVMPEFKEDTLAGSSYRLDSLGRKAKKVGVKLSDYYVDYNQEQKDSVDQLNQIDSLGLRKNSLRNWIYNTYNKVSRNVTSARAYDNPRNWRAYYLGVWAGFDDWNVSLTGNGKRGQGLGLGILGGYTLPLIPQKYPREGSLDLDLGIAIGVKGVKYDAYTYVASNADGQRYVDDPSRSQTSWKIVPYPVIQDIHVSLVWRFRGIKHKVDNSIIDDYFSEVAGFEKGRSDLEQRENLKSADRDRLAQLIRDRLNVVSDSTGFWDNFHIRRLNNARRINPDTIFTDKDYILYLKITEKVDTTEAKVLLERIKENRQDSIEHAADSIAKQQRIMARQARKDSIALADSLEDVRREFRRDSIANAKQARRDSISLADSIAKQQRIMARQARKDSIALADSLEDVRKMLRRDSLERADSLKKADRLADRLRKDSIEAAQDSIEAARKDSIRAAKKAKKQKKEDEPSEEDSSPSVDAPLAPIEEDNDSGEANLKKEDEEE